MVAQCFQEASQRVSPLWDIRDYVAVNPFFGFREQSFLDVARWFQRFSKDSFFPKKDYFLKKFSSGEVTDYDLETAIRLYHKQHGLTGTHTIHFHEAVEFLNTAQESNNEFKVKCLSDLYDLQNQSNTTKKNHRRDLKVGGRVLRRRAGRVENTQRRFTILRLVEVSRSVRHTFWKRQCRFCGARSSTSPRSHASCANAHAKTSRKNLAVPSRAQHLFLPTV